MTLETIQDDLLSEFRHAFFTRKGGASSGIFEGLNCGYGSSDQRAAVATNRARVAAELQLEPEALVTVHQTHSADVIEVTGPFETPPKADGMVSKTPGLALGILTADCQPVLFGDAEARVIGAAHAGWGGALSGILEETVSAMVALGAERSHIKAVIGPCISQASYEVGPDYMERFLDDDPENARFFAGGAGDRVQFDLPGYGLKRLRDAGVEAQWCRHCTYRDPGRFFSYRRSVHRGEPDYGRLIATIRL